MEIENKLLRVLLKNDGSMTVALEALTGRKIDLKIITQNKVENCEFFKGPCVHREVVLKAGEKGYLHAVSFIDLEIFEKLGLGSDVPVGLVLRDRKIGQFRDIYRIESVEIDLGLSERIEERCGRSFKRQYYVYIDGKPLIHIEETLLPDLLEEIGFEQAT